MALIVHSGTAAADLLAAQGASGAFTLNELREQQAWANSSLVVSTTMMPVVERVRNPTDYLVAALVRNTYSYAPAVIEPPVEPLRVAFKPPWWYYALCWLVGRQPMGVPDYALIRRLEAECA